MQIANITVSDILIEFCNKPLIKTANLKLKQIQLNGTESTQVILKTANDTDFVDVKFTSTATQSSTFENVLKKVDVKFGALQVNYTPTAAETLWRYFSERSVDV